MAGLDRCRVLVLDDDRGLLGLMRELLEDEGCRVWLAEAPLAPPQVAALAPDVIVLDLVVGGEVRGEACLRALRAEPATRQIPVVVCSAAVDAMRRLDRRLLRPEDELLPKPFDIDELLAAIPRTVDGGGNPTGWIERSDQRRLRPSSRPDDWPEHAVVRPTVLFEPGI